MSSAADATTATDVLIVGGGMVGASLALALLSDPATPLSVMLVEAHPPPLGAAQDSTYQPSFDARSTALSLSSVGLFDDIGVWRDLRRRAQQIRRIHVSDRGRFGSTTMDCAEEGLPALGYVVENPWLGRILYQGLSAAPRLELLAPARVRSYTARRGGYAVRIESGNETRTVQPGLLVLADGADSAGCRALGIATELRDYDQVAVTANVGHRRSHHDTAFERFTDHGPMALLPLVPDAGGRARSALIWVESRQRAQELLQTDDAGFLALLQQRFGYRAGRFERLGNRNQYPLRLTRATEQQRPGLVVLGNAAHTLHPVAGQGFNLSLRDVACLAALVREARQRGQCPGNRDLLERYLARQRRDQQQTSGFSDALPRLFGNGALPLALARDAGLIGLDLLAPLRRRFVQFATGLASAGSGEMR